ncbi:thermonuclease family protein [Halobacillus campisalis]|uniref:Thermonuclease family protein n=1 Tax=Halobacillus campisalis TaxID=435909 RepID=A0ABW2K4Q9_9BACI|nr:thermonuclease family protein [Halobacillus campisalis]
MPHDDFRDEIDLIYMKPLENGLLPGEVILLDWLNGKNFMKATFPLYFEYDYGIDALRSAENLIKENYLEQATIYESLPHFKVAELKEILKHHNLKVSGKKAVLVDRIKEEIPLADLQHHIVDTTLKLTSKGEDVFKKYYYIIPSHKSSSRDGIYYPASAIRFVKQSNHTPSNSEISWGLYTRAKSRYERERNFGLLTIVLINMANQLYNEEDYEHAHNYYLHAFILSTSGLHNGFIIEDPENISPMPTSKRLNQLIEILKLNSNDLKWIFNKSWVELKNTLPHHALDAETCFNCLLAHIEEDEDKFRSLVKNFFNIQTQINETGVSTNEQVYPDIADEKSTPQTSNQPYEQNEKALPKKELVKNLLMSMHSDFIYMVEGGLYKSNEPNQYSAITQTGIFAYSYQKGKLIELEQTHWKKITRASIDFRAMSTLLALNGKVYKIINNSKKVLRTAEEKCNTNIEKQERKWHQKIVGFRTGKAWKMVTAILIYIFLVGTSVDALTEENDNLTDVANTEDVMAETDTEPKNSSNGDGADPNKKDEEELKAAEEEEAEEQKEQEEKYKKEAEEQAQAEKERKEKEAEEKAQAEKEKAEQEAKEKAEAEAAEKKKNETNATLTRVIDGDTIEVSMDGKTEDVRLLLIDTPETVHPSEPVQPYGPEATQFVKDTLSGEEVRVKVGSEERDNYGRLLAYVFIDGETIQEKLLEKGLARTAYLYNDLTMLDEFHAAQQKAIDSGKGVWSIDGYAHKDHDHGYHFEEEHEPEPEPEEPSNDGLLYDPFGPDRDCGDFPDHASAQAFFEAAGGPANDPHDLNRDTDGIACDSLQ